MCSPTPSTNRSRVLFRFSVYFSSTGEYHFTIVTDFSDPFPATLKNSLIWNKSSSLCDLLQYVWIILKF